MSLRVRRSLLSAAAAAVLWLLSGLAHVALASDVYVTRVLSVLVPTPTNALFWTFPPPWSFVALLFGGLSIAALLLVVLNLIVPRPGGGPAITSAWFGVVVAGAITGLAIDGILVLNSVQVVGWRGLTIASVQYAVIGAYWGLVQGWIPALIASGGRDATTSLPTARRALAWPAVAAVVSLLLFAVTGTLGSAAAQREIVEEQAATDAVPPGLGAAPDPDAPGTPPPMAAPSAQERDPSWCTPEQAMVLQGSDDAATGHRVLSLRVTNFSDEPCVVEGYPDIAFGDQNGNELSVTVDRGSSFMATDAGARPVEIPPGGYAIAFVGWDANATAGALVANTIYAAQVPGDTRGSWPVVLDIVDGSTVEITAWELDELGPATDSQG